MISNKRQNEVFSIDSYPSAGWLVYGIAAGIPHKNETQYQKGVVYVPNHGSKEVATGTALNILKSAGLK